VHHRRLSRAVWTDDAQQLAGLHVKRKIVQRLEPVEAEGEVFQVQALVASGLSRRHAHLRFSREGSSPASPRGRNNVTSTKRAPSAYSQTSGNAPVRYVFA